MTSLAPLRRAEILAVGTELTIGSTRDTNSARLAAELSARGVEVTRITALPDRLGVVREGFEAAIGRADLVISTGGLGPTPDDLTRESIAAACGREPYVDAFLERWLRELFHRRGLAMAEANLKQAWLIEGATALANHQGTAPGWWVEPDDLHVIVAMPGPPREMWPMWRTEVLPRLESRGLGQESAAETLRLTGIGESALADLIGEAILRAPDPEVATYARADAV
nr:competence/damage-inducible protein A [Chloroflexota bacterium]